MQSGDFLHADPQRIAYNEARFRDVNEAIKRGSWPGEEDGTAAFRCECAQLDCNLLVPITPREYERVRANPRHFLVLPSHEAPPAEAVVDRRPDYVIVEKLGEAGRVAEANDPRS